MTMTDTADARGDRAAVHRAGRGRIGDGARHRQPARSGGRGARDQAADARRRLHGAAHRRLPLQRPPAADASIPTARARSTSTASTPATSAPAQRRDEQFATICQVAVDHGKPVRIGVNGGSLNQELVVAKMQENTDRNLGKTLRGDHQRVHGAVGDRVDGARASRAGLRKDQIIISCKTSRPRDLIAVYRALARQTDQPLHLGLTEAGMGIEGAGLVGVGDGRAAERRHRRHDSRLADAAARRRSARRGLRRVRAAAGARPALVLAERHRVPGLRPHDEPTFQELAERDPGLHPRADARVEDARTRASRR